MLTLDSLPVPMERDRFSEAYERAIAIERVRSAARLNALRLGSLSAFGLLTLAFRVFSPDWIGPQHILAVYWLAALAVRMFFRGGSWAVAASAWFIPFVDVPMILWLMSDNAAELSASGLPAHEHAIRLGAGAFFILIVFLSSLSLEVSRVVIVAGAAMIAEVVLMALGTPDMTWLVFMPTTTAVAAALAVYIVRRTERLVRGVVDEQLRREKLGRYFPPQVAAHIEKLSGEALGAGETREVTLLFADIRDFTRLSETLSGPETVTLLNEFHGTMVEAIFASGGTLDKFMGDGIMAYFGAPLVQPDHADRACRAAIEMVSRLDTLNRWRSSRGLAPLRMGIGIHTGSVVLGDIGAPGRRDFTAIGSAVNVASRLQQATREQDVTVLVSDETKRLVSTEIAFERVLPAAIRGRDVPVECWTLP
jgi:adenylate cyclase